jgi:hypothetical protein
MSLIKHYRPDGLDIEISEGNTVKLMVLRNNQKRGIIARIKGSGPIVLWDKDNADDHVGDTEEQFIDKIKEVLG